MSIYNGDEKEPISHSGEIAPYTGDSQKSEITSEQRLEWVRYLIDGNKISSNTDADDFEYLMDEIREALDGKKPKGFERVIGIK